VPAAARILNRILVSSFMIPFGRRIGRGGSPLARHRRVG
jgi:hypothetical protein